MSEGLKNYIDKRRAYFWYTPKSELHNISDQQLVETILNDGSLDDFRELVAEMGIDQVADIFFSAKGRAVNNYYPEVRNFYTLVFKRYAYRNPQS